MKKYKVHICLVSAQNTANITPVFDSSVSPEKIVLCVTDKMKKNADYLSYFLEKKHINTEVFLLGNGYDFYELKEKFLEVFDKYANEIAAVNLTGGNKLMALAAQDVFHGEFPLFYVSPDAVITEISGFFNKFKLNTKLRIEDILNIYGYKVIRKEKNKNISEKSRYLFENIFKDINGYSDPISTLNYFASNAYANKCLFAKGTIKKECFKLLNLFQEQNSIVYFNDREIRFRDENAIRFCMGFWFEEAIYLKLIRLKDDIGFDDFASSIEIEKGEGVVNELDFAYSKDNELNIIECKTSNLLNSSGDIIYKSFTLKNYTSVFAKSTIISFRKLKNNLRQRAKDLNIKIIHGEEINNIEKLLLID